MADQESRFEWAVPHDQHYPTTPVRPLKKVRMMQMVVDRNNDGFTYYFQEGKLIWEYFAHLLKL